MSCRLSFVMFLLVLPAFCPAQGPAHVFTNKDGIKITAEIVDVSTDWKNLVIRKDGAEFTISPTVLNLDGQQFVKDWLKAKGILEPGMTPAATSSFSAPPPAPPLPPAPPEPSAPIPAAPIPAVPPSVAQVKTRPLQSSLSFAYSRKKAEAVDRKRSDFGRYDTKKYPFELTVTSTGREPISEPVLHYAIIWRERVIFTEDSYDEIDSVLCAIKGKKEFQALVYNRPESLLSAPVEINSIINDGGQVYREDQLIGVWLRLTSRDGTLLGESRSPEVEKLNLTWNEVEALRATPYEE